MGDVIELRGIVNRSEEARQIVEKGVVASADKDIDLMSAGRANADALIGRYRGRKAAAREANESHIRAIVAVNRYPNLRRPQYFEISLFDPFEIGQQPGKTGVIAVWTSDAAVRR